MNDISPVGNVTGPYDELSRILAELPRPRPVRMTRRGKMTAGIVSIVLLISLGIYAASDVFMRRDTAGQLQSPLYALSFAIIVMFTIVMVKMIGRQKRLLADGEMASARVTNMWATRNGQAIRYEFTTPLGEHFSRSAADGSRKVSIGMNVPVFYDPQKPKKQLALCSSFYEVVMPGEE